MTAEERKANLKKLHPCAVNRLRRMQAMGMHHRQVVFELHCREGRPLTEVAALLGMTHSGVSHHWVQVQEMLAEQAPRTPEQLTAVREEVAARLWATVEQTYGRTEVVDEDGEVTLVEEAPTPQLLAIRLRALEQISKLYGVLGETPGVAGGGVPGMAVLSPYVTPAVLAEEVRARRLALYGRGSAAGVVEAEA